MSAKKMEKIRKEEMRTQRKVSHICLLLLVLLQVTTAQNTTTAISSVNTTTITTSAANPAALSYRTRPADIVVPVGKPAVFRCGVPTASPRLVFIFQGSHGNYSLACPGGNVENIPQALYGSCEMKNGESLAVWTLRGTSFSDNGTQVVCQQSENPETPVAFLHVYDNGTSYATLIGCTIGGFFGILLVFGLSFTMLKRSETLQKWFRGKEREDDMATIVTKE